VNSFCKLIPVGGQSKAWVCRHLIAGIMGSHPAEGMDVKSLVFVVCCVCSCFCNELITHSEESYRSRVCLIVCDLETSTIWAFVPQKKKIMLLLHFKCVLYYVKINKNHSSRNPYFQKNCDW